MIVLGDLAAVIDGHLQAMQSLIPHIRVANADDERNDKSL